MTGIHILLVDDEAPFRSALGKRLTKRGMVIEEAGAGEEALEKLRGFAADIVLLDVKMPGMDGIATLHRIKQEWPLVEVIMLTGHASMEMAIQGMELGAFDYLMKPVEIEELLYKLEDASTRKRHREEKIAARAHTE
ncbi:response regulator [Pseudodesulfovibrio sediminis]|uniref:Two-component system response regulator n=1 Tax=Pseudodesulfovibrio sediminis TaxID=2810563 RepID=A0ABM7P9Q8_9BACT|nr:response regulator [Pseudodesulfovibrio sediminis]BCS89710.1 two-component system response regulator [Pseudodesulfovibrio sediminis]